MVYLRAFHEKMERRYPVINAALDSYDIRDTLTSSIQPILDRASPFLEWSRSGEIADTALSVIDSHLANEPRTKAETALIEFAEGKARAIARGDHLPQSSCEIPREILQAFVEEMK